jgi:glutathione S-transferase
MTMELFFAPLACSMATRIALYEAGAEARFTRVDTRTKRTAEGDDFLAINPLGQVPVLRTDGGEILTENAAILQHVADRFPAAGLAPPAGLARSRLQQWLSFIGSELHKLVFTPLLSRDAGEEAKAFARSKAALRFGHLDRHLAGHAFLLDRFSVADAYLVTVLNWSPAAGVDLAPWADLRAYRDRMLARSGVARAVAEERALYAAAAAPPRAA